MPTRPAPCALALAAVLATASAAHALVVTGGAMPAPEQGYIGSWNGGTAVAVGQQWILTAAHVGGSEHARFVMNGQAHTGAERITHASADLALVRIDGALDHWHAITDDVSAGDRVVLGGAGLSAGDAVRGGYSWSDSREIAWGENTILRERGDRLEIRFDAGRAALQHEAGFAMHDSGAGVFVEGADGSLALAGIAVGVNELGATRHGSVSYAIDLSNYIDWIASIIGDQRLPVLHDDDPAARAISTPAPSAAALLSLSCIAIARRRRH